MNSTRLRSTSMWTKFATLAAFAGVVGLLGCDQSPVTGGTNDETSSLAFYLPSGKPAVGARVSIYGSADKGIEPRNQVVVDANGHANLPAPEKGYYNIVVSDRKGHALYQDSLYSNGGALPAASDTLRATGVITGRVRVQSQHAPQIAWVQLLGAGVYLNVDDSGNFRLEGIAAGRFTLVGLTDEEGYTPTFAKVQAFSDSTVDVGVLDLIYTGLPVVKNLEASFDTLAGLVSLRWDSIALRQTWRYNVYRDDILLGQTIGPRWIDMVSDEYPGNVPSQGRHTYRVAMANADSVGAKWESITMQVISPMLYQKIRFDWHKLSALPWKGGVYRIDTTANELVCWRSPGDSIANLQKWVSADSGRNWALVVDSLRVDALPVWFEQRWWTTWNRSSGDSTEVWTSQDGKAWTALNAVVHPAGVSGWRLEPEAGTLDLMAVCEDDSLCRHTFFDYVSVPRGWRWTGTAFAEKTSADTMGSISAGGGIAKRGWSDGGWWHISILRGMESIYVDGGYAQFDVSAYPLSYSRSSLEMGYYLFRIGSRRAVFSNTTAWSVDSTGTEVNVIAWPGSGPHFERRYGGGILSVSDSGVWLGQVLPERELDPRGTWVKQTEIPVVY